MLIVFDLDFTLWDAGGTWCDHTTPPYHPENSSIIDGQGRQIVLYPDVVEILKTLSQQRIPMALASRTHSPRIANTFLEMFGIRHHFAFMEIYPGSKTQHFSQLQKHSGLTYERMFFFDDEYRNITEVGNMGVHTRLVDSGLTWREIEVFPELCRVLNLTCD